MPTSKDNASRISAFCIPYLCILPLYLRDKKFLFLRDDFFGQPAYPRLFRTPRQSRKRVPSPQTPRGLSLRPSAVLSTEENRLNPLLGACMLLSITHPWRYF